MNRFPSELCINYNQTILILCDTTYKNMVTIIVIIFNVYIYIYIYIYYKNNDILLCIISKAYNIQGISIINTIKIGINIFKKNNIIL